MKPYEYFDGTLGVQSRFIFYGKNAATESICVIGDRGLQLRISKGQIERLRVSSPGIPALVKWQSIPIQWQAKLLERFGVPAALVKQNWFKEYFQRDTKALEYYLSYTLEDGSNLPDDIIEEYTVNASILNTIRKLHKKKADLLKATNRSVTDFWEIISDECNQLKDVYSHTIPLNTGSIRRKLRQYSHDGYPALIHGNWCNKSAQKVDEDVLNLLNNMFADTFEKPTATEVYRRYDGFINGLVEVYKHIDKTTGEYETYDPFKFPKLSPATVKNYLAKWVNKAATHTLRSGDRQKWINTFKPHHSLKQPKYSGSIISIDDRQPPFEYAPSKRVWFYNGIDLASEAITVWVYGTSKDGIIDEFYRQLVRNYTEWGVPMPAELEGEMSLNSKFLNTFLKEGVLFKYVRIEANNARGKRIEAYYNQLRYGLEKGREGWIARPFAIRESNQAGPKQVPLVPYEDIISGCLHDIQAWNNMEHSKIKGKSRWQVFVENQLPGERPTNWRAFLPYLGYKTETSCRLGIIRFNNKQFLLGIGGEICYSNNLIRLMEQIEGRDVDVFWLDDSSGNVLKALVYLSGSRRYICEAIPKPSYVRARAEQTEEDESAKIEMSKYVASVQGFINRSRAKIDKVTLLDNRPITIDNSFKIEQKKDVFETNQSQHIPEFEESETLPDLDEIEDDLKDLETRFNRSLKDRF